MTLGGTRANCGRVVPCHWEAAKQTSSPLAESLKLDVVALGSAAQTANCTGRTLIKRRTICDTSTTSVGLRQTPKRFWLRRDNAQLALAGIVVDPRTRTPRSLGAA